MLELVPYSKEWNKDFEKIKKDIAACVDGKILRVDHIGSTAIPSLSAKDIIDVQIGVSNIDCVESLIKPMQDIGFDLLPHIKMDHAPGHEFDEFVPGWEKRFFKANEKRRAANIHVRLISGKNFEFALLFRDFLRQDKEAARAYEQVKIRLEEYLSDNVKAYTLIKDPVCDLIILLARKWARDSGWSISRE